jgi:hypothetical protein
MLEALYADDALSPVFKIVEWAYSDLTSLLLKTPSGEIFSVIQSEQGTRQGDPFGMLLFCLGIKRAIDDVLQEGGPTVRAVAVADDVTFVGPVDGRDAAIASLDLVLRGDKSKLLNFTNATLDPTALEFARSQNIPIITDATVLLGTPVGSNLEAVQLLALNKISKGAALFDSLKHPLMPTTIADRMLRFAGAPRESVPGKSWPPR